MVGENGASRSMPLTSTTRGAPARTEPANERLPFSVVTVMRITINTEKGKRSFAGSVLAGTPRVIEVKGMDLDAPFSPRMLYVNNLDKPGFIGALGALLAEAGVNIATFNLGRVSAGEDAIALVGVDQEPADDLLGKIQKLPHVKEARALVF